jgi:hypothetical protein
VTLAGFVASAAAGLASFSASNAQLDSIATGDPAIDALVSDIVAGQREQAIDRIASVSSMAGDHKRLVRTPTQFVDRLLRCVPLAGSAKPVYGRMVQLMWSCGEVKYRAIFESKVSKPYIVVMLEDKAMIAMRAVTPPRAPSPPIPIPQGSLPVSPYSPSLALLNTIAAAAVFGKFGPVHGIIRPQTSIRVARRDLAANVTIDQLDDDGLEVFVAYTQVVFRKVGRPTGFNCRSEQYSGTCEFTFKDSRSVLSADVGAKNEAVNYVSYTWVAAE